MGKVMSVGMQTATKIMHQHSEALSLKDFDNAVHVNHEDGSVFKIQNACKELWTDEQGEEWLFVFCEHFDDMCFAVDDLESFSLVTFQPEEIHYQNRCNCLKCGHVWDGAYTNDLQMCAGCYSEYHNACTCSQCGNFKGGHTENLACKYCGEPP